MHNLNNSVQWEQFFIQEALELEEKMRTLDADSLNKSKLRISLEHGILEWTHYEKWYMSQLGCASLKESVGPAEIEKFVAWAQKAATDYAQYDFWNSDLIPLTTWDGQLIVIGLQYSEKLVSLGSAIFILSPPQILNAVFSKLSAAKPKDTSLDDFKLEDAESEISDALEGLNFNQAAPKISFTLIQPPSAVTVNETDAPAASPSVAIVTPPPVAPTAATPPNVNVSLTSEPKTSPPPPPATEERVLPSVFTSTAAPDPAEGVWEFISERHQEYSFEAKKQFDAFVILKIKDKKTQVFKMDADLHKQSVNPMIFEYQLDNEGPFKTVFNGRKSDSFSMQQMDMYLSDFQNAYITPLIRGDKVMGFFVGFKKSGLSQQDKNLLQELAEETAS